MVPQYATFRTSCPSLGVVFMVPACGRGRQHSLPLPTAGYCSLVCGDPFRLVCPPLGSVRVAVSPALTAHLPLSTALGHQARALSDPVYPLPTGV